MYLNTVRMIFIQPGIGEADEHRYPVRSLHMGETIIKRSCNSSISRKDESIAFNAFNIKLEGNRKTVFEKIRDHLFEKGFYFPETPDVEARILAHILDVGLFHMEPKDDEGEEE